MENINQHQKVTGYQTPRLETGIECGPDSFSDTYVIKFKTKKNFLKNCPVNFYKNWTFK
jgi:hypothetical protein